MKIIRLAEIIAALIFFIMPSTVFGAVNKLDIELFGTDSFKQTILELDNEDENNIKDAIFVAPYGNDTNSGSIDKPFKTIQAAADAVKAGGMVLVRGGEYSENIYLCVSGREDAYVTIKNYPNELPIIKGTKKSDEGIFNIEADYIRIEGFEICDYSAKWAYGIICSEPHSNIIIRNNKIHDIKCANPNNPDSSGANGIIFLGEAKTPISNVLVENNEVYNLVTSWSEAISIAGNCEYINIINNKVSNNTNIGIDFYGNAGYCSDPAQDQPRYGIAAGNIVTGSVCPYATSYGLYVDGARDIVFENNISYDNQGGIEIGSEEKSSAYPVKNIIVRNNLVYDNLENGITIGGYDKNTSGIVYDTKIYNNTVVNNGNSEYTGELHISMCENIDIRNNIFMKSTDEPLIVSDFDESSIKKLTFKNNMYYSNADSSEANFELYLKTQHGFEAFKDLTGENGIYSNPMLSDTYSLIKGSPAIDSGDDSVSVGVKDIAGSARRSGAIDIGCYEYQWIEESSESTTDEAENTTIFYGDVNNDNVLSAEDAGIILRYVLNRTSVGFDEEHIKRANVTGSEVVTSADAAFVLFKVLDNRIKFPVK